VNYRLETIFPNKERFKMKIVGISGTIVGSKTRTALDFALQILHDHYPDVEKTLVDLADYDISFSDGRPYREYVGDTKKVAETIMEGMLNRKTNDNLIRGEYSWAKKKVHVSNL
jgi:hypothetical protein